MAGKRYVFLDFDNTLSDQVPFNLQYAREVGATMKARFGGERHDWEWASAELLITMQGMYFDRFVGAPLNGYRAWLEETRVWAMERVLAKAGLPTSDFDLRQLALETQFGALSTCDATFPGTGAALATLHENGYVIHMASANDSEWLLASLIGGGIESYIDIKYGPDLIDCAKEGPEFFERIFAELGVNPGEAVMVDDQPQVLAWAKQHGAKLIQVQLTEERHFPKADFADAHCEDMADLPRIVNELLG